MAGHFPLFSVRSLRWVWRDVDELRARGRRVCRQCAIAGARAGLARISHSPMPRSAAWTSWQAHELPAFNAKLKGTRTRADHREARLTGGITGLRVSSMRAIRLLLVAMLFCSAGANAEAPPSLAHTHAGNRRAGKARRITIDIPRQRNHDLVVYYHG